MSRSTFVKSASFSLLLVTSIFAVTAACEEITQPCDSASDLDGLWRVMTINGQPAMNWPLPTTTDRFHSGVIEFYTDFNDDCTPNGNAEGTAVAIYAIRKNDGSFQSDRITARFWRTGRSQDGNSLRESTITLKATTYTVSGTQTGITMTLPGAHPKFGNATLVLVKQ